MSGGQLFDATGEPSVDARPGVRSTDLPASRDAACRAGSTVHENRLIILSLLVEYGWLTQFCPYVLLGFKDCYRQPRIGTRFKSLRDPEGLIEYTAKRCPRPGAESNAVVSCFQITDAGRVYLAEQQRRAA